MLAPWANRLDGDAYWANGKRYLLNPDAVEIRRDSNGLPIHGLLLFASAWEVARLHADEQGRRGDQPPGVLEASGMDGAVPLRPHHHDDASAVWRHARSPHHHRKSFDGPMPLVIGFHPWYQIPDAPRDQWKVHLPVREHYVLSQKVIPTGETKPVDLPDPTPLAGRQLDDVFGGVDPNSEFSLEANGRKVSVRFGPKFPIAIVYAPNTRDVVCFEPMTGLTNGFNLAHEGIFKNLQSVPPGGNVDGKFLDPPQRILSRARLSKPVLSASNRTRNNSPRSDTPATPTSPHSADRRPTPRHRPNPCCGRWRP